MNLPFLLQFCSVRVELIQQSSTLTDNFNLHFFCLQVPADVEKCQDRVECFNADLKADMERWQNNKRQDFRQLLMGMADKNIQYYEKVCATVGVLAGIRVVYFPLK